MTFAKWKNLLKVYQHFKITATDSSFRRTRKTRVLFPKGKTHSWITLTIFISSSLPTILWGNVHQLQNKGSPGDNSSTPWEQIPPHKTFQHRTLSTALKSGKQLHYFLKHKNAVVFQSAVIWLAQSTLLCLLLQSA